MNAKQKKLQKWLNNEDISLMDMYFLASTEGWTDCVVESQEIIRDWILEQVREGVAASDVLKALEENDSADLFKWDACLGSMSTPEPISNKQDLFDILN